MDDTNLRWWGWGTLDKTYSLENRPHFWPALRSWLALPSVPEERPAVALEEIDLRPSRADDPVLASLRRLVGEEAVRVDKQTRIEHALGKAYRDLIRVRGGDVPNPPDAVVYPADEGQVAAVLAWAARRDIAVIPFGGGSTVLGSVEPGSGDQVVLTMDMARLDRVVSLDETSWTAEIQAGATGPEIEAQLNARGFTLGHFPQSFEFSTLGGWIATRAAGQTSTGFGKIEDMTQAVRLVSPIGILETRNVPASATGPSLLQMILGSEGTFGVITEATMRVHPLPDTQDYRGFLFRSLEEGSRALRGLMQGGPRPTIARLSDAAETAAFAALAHEHQGVRALADRAVAARLARAGHDLSGGSSLLLLGYEGDRRTVRRCWRTAASICSDCGGLALGRRAAASWERDRFLHPYLRDTLLGVGVMVDTLETATTWSNLMHLYREMTNALRGAIRATGGGPGYVMTHISHTYEWGASLYTTFLAKQVAGQELEQWRLVKQAATEAILASGGTLSHHHGVGRDHAEWLIQEVGPLGVTILRALRQTLDPASIMNPGVLVSSA